MPHQFKFHATNDPEKLLQLYLVCATEWSGNLSHEEFARNEVQKHENYNRAGEKTEGFYLEDSETGEIIATATVRRGKGLYKEADRSSALNSVPDVTSIGVKNVKTLLLGYVFTAKQYRKLGLAGEVVRRAIEFTEAEIIKQHLDESDASKNDSFKNMVMTDGYLDKRLAHYYLGKQYMWILYSAAGNFYERFGFKSYPLDFYRIPTSVLSKEDEELIHTLFSSNEKSPDPNVTGKKLKLLKYSNKQDRDLISFILQGRELEILTDLNKMVFHTELSDGSKSSSSLTNVSSVLSMSKKGSSNELSSIGQLTPADLGVEPKQRRRSSVSLQPGRKSSMQQLVVPKFSVKPSMTSLEALYAGEDAQAKTAERPEEAIKYTDIKGVVFTNDLQQKNYYILWATLPFNKLFILGIGELKFDLIGALVDPAGAAKYSNSLPQRRMSTGFTGLNELGGHNFQDLNVLIHAAMVVAKSRQLTDTTAVFVSVNDLPNNIPTPVLHDYFLNYLPATFEDVYKEDETDKPEEKRVRLINDASQSFKVLPMLRKFGSDKTEFDLDWHANGMWSWG